MFRAFLFFLVLASAAIAAVWVAGQPGDAQFTWLGYQVSMTMPAFVGFVFMGYIAAYLLFVLTMLPLRLARLLSRDRRYARESDMTCIRLAMQADGALLAEDSAAAKVLLDKLDRRLPPGRKDIVNMLHAKLAHLQGSKAGESPYLRLLASPLTAPIGYRWLIESNAARGNLARALDFARRASSSECKAPWIDRWLINLLIRQENYEEALAALAEAKKRGHVSAAECAAKKTRLYLVMAKNSADDEARGKWIDLALAAKPVSLAASMAGARYYSRLGRRDRALTILRDSWREAPSWPAYKLYADLLAGTESVEFLGKVEALVRPAKDAPLAALAKGDAYYRQRLWGQAGKELAVYLASAEPNAHASALMAGVEDALGNHESAARWREKAAESLRG
ncbi:hypothetical protein FACS1894186_3560 [Alphaproteobacteria bacterium]|nr:hypothetical protein FACS1894186_3560 [Alphaproteobacteria bacterium]